MHLWKQSFAFINGARFQFIWSLVLISCGVCFCADNAGVALVNFYADW